MVFIGVDPGKGGGFGVVNERGEFMAAWKMPETDQDILELVGQLVLYEDRLLNPRAVAVLEFVRSSPQMGVKSAFSFGCGYGGLRMALAAKGVPFEEATPQFWQATMGCRTRGDKNVSKARAQALFPGHHLTHATADAALLAEYCRRVHLGLAPRPGSKGKSPKGTDVF